MIIEKLKLRNFRGIEKVNIKFDKQINVIYGANGAGKSTVLDAIVIMLSWAANRIKHSGSSGKPIVENDIKNGEPFASIKLVTDEADWKIVKTRRGNPSQGKSNYTELKRFTNQIQEELFNSEAQINLPLFVYYPINRAVIDIPLRIRGRHDFDVLSAYDEALGGGASFRTFFEWFRQREDIENEAKVNSEGALFGDDEDITTDSQLKVVRHAWELFLPEFKNFRVKRSPLRLEVEKNGKKVSVNQLSDGEKILITKIGDLARRLAIANPKLKDPLSGQAIVLIDEIDLHLHPKWQRMVIDKLPKVFPKCQFIVSTHSPHVITHTKIDNLIRLTQVDMNVDWERPTESYGKNVDRVLEDLMGLNTTRPDSVSDKISTIYTLIDKAQLASAKNKILELKQLIGEDPDLVKAEVLIKRKEIIGR